MSSSTPANQDPALVPPPPATAAAAGPPAADAAASPHLLDSTQVVQLLRHFPSVYQVSRTILLPFPFPPFLLRAGCTTPCSMSRLERDRICVTCRLLRAST